MELFVAILLFVAKASVATVASDTIAFTVDGHKILVPLNRPIHVTRIKGASLSDLNLPHLAELLASAAHSAAAPARPADARPGPADARPGPTDARPGPAQHTTHSLPDTKPSNEHTPHVYPEQRANQFTRTAASAYPAQPPRPTDPPHSKPQYARTNHLNPNLLNAGYRETQISNTRYLDAQNNNKESINNNHPYLHIRNYPENQVINQFATQSYPTSYRSQIQKTNNRPDPISASHVYSLPQRMNSPERRAQTSHPEHQLPRSQGQPAAEQGALWGPPGPGEAPPALSPVPLVKLQPPYTSYVPKDSSPIISHTKTSRVTTLVKMPKVETSPGTLPSENVSSLDYLVTSTSDTIPTEDKTTMSSTETSTTDTSLTSSTDTGTTEGTPMTSSNDSVATTNSLVTSSSDSVTSTSTTDVSSSNENTTTESTSVTSSTDTITTEDTTISSSTGADTITDTLVNLSNADILATPSTTVHRATISTPVIPVTNIAATSGTLLKSVSLLAISTPELTNITLSTALDATSSSEHNSLELLNHKSQNELATASVEPNLASEQVTSISKNLTSSKKSMTTKSLLTILTTATEELSSTSEEFTITTEPVSTMDLPDLRPTDTAKVTSPAEIFVSMTEPETTTTDPDVHSLPNDLVTSLSKELNTVLDLQSTTTEKIVSLSEKLKLSIDPVALIEVPYSKVISAELVKLPIRNSNSTTRLQTTTSFSELSSTATEQSTDSLTVVAVNNSAITLKNLKSLFKKVTSLNDSIITTALPDSTKAVFDRMLPTHEGLVSTIGQEAMTLPESMITSVEQFTTLSVLTNQQVMSAPLAEFESTASEQLTTSNDNFVLYNWPLTTTAVPDLMKAASDLTTSPLKGFVSATDMVAMTTVQDIMGGDTIGSDLITSELVTPPSKELISSIELITQTFMPHLRPADVKIMTSLSEKNILPETTTSMDVNSTEDTTLPSEEGTFLNNPILVMSGLQQTRSTTKQVISVSEENTLPLHSTLTTADRDLIMPATERVTQPFQELITEPLKFTVVSDLPITANEQVTMPFKGFKSIPKQVSTTLFPNIKTTTAEQINTSLKMFTLTEKPVLPTIEPKIMLSSELLIEAITTSPIPAVSTKTTEDVVPSSDIFLTSTLKPMVFQAELNISLPKTSGDLSIDATKQVSDTDIAANGTTSLNSQISLSSIPNTETTTLMTLLSPSPSTPRADSAASSTATLATVPVLQTLTSPAIITVTGTPSSLTSPAKITAKLKYSTALQTTNVLQKSSKGWTTARAAWPAAAPPVPRNATRAPCRSRKSRYKRKRDSGKTPSSMKTRTGKQGVSSKRRSTRRRMPPRTPRTPPRTLRSRTTN